MFLLSYDKHKEVNNIRHFWKQKIYLKRTSTDLV
jgi:hypothetical protein